MTNFTRKILWLPLLFIITSLSAQNNFWKDVNESSLKSNQNERTIVPKKYRTLSLETESLLLTLKNAPKEFSTEAMLNPFIIAIPMPDGTINHFKLVEYSMMEPGLSAKFSDIKTYSGQGIEDRTATIKADWTEFGFHAMILSNVTGSVWIDPYTRGDKNNYISYFKTDLTPKFMREETVLSPSNEAKAYLDQAVAAGPCLGTTLRSYRTAVACTGEYAVAVGGTTAALLHSAIVTSVNRVNGVYEKEVAIRLVLIANNNLIEYLNAATDPFTGNTTAATLINESQTVINANIGSANYDIGHTFSTGGGGLAQLGCVCTSASKARGITGSTLPVGDAYDIDFVAHEMGHQFGGSHTFNAATGNCSGNGSATSNVEPGSGTTIMAYAGICDTTNDVQNNSDPQFHAISFDQIGTYTRSSTGSTCGTAITTGNTPPVVNAGVDYTIPISTPFTLTGSATDVNGDALTYSWEQEDIGAAFGNWNVTTGTATPLFRSYQPSTSNSRTFPAMSSWITNRFVKGEVLPSVARTMKFRLTARDNRAGGGGVCFDQMNVITSGTTAFNVTSQPTAVTWTANGMNTAIITWTVAGTTLSPFNSPTVDILLSVDGGFTYPYILASNTTNDGTETIVIPSATTQQGRIMVKSKGNIFFDINTGVITIASACGAQGAIVAPATSVTATAGNAILNLGLSPQYSTPLSIAGTLETTDPASSLAITDSATGACLNASNVMKYDSYTFTPSATATYTFTLTGVFPTIMNLYSGSFNGSASCNNLLKSNGLYTGTTVRIGSSISFALTVGSTYTLILGTFSITQPVLPAAYSIAITGGTIYSGTAIYFNPGATFNYTYVIVNTATNIIKGISTTANLTNSTTYPAGTYSVYGLSYANTITNLSTYVGQNLSVLQNLIFSSPSTFCGNFSKNIVSVTITAAPVPITLLSLTGKKVNDKVVLNWSTSSEQNASHFNIMRSRDGRNFTSNLGKVSASGNSNTLKNYTFTDALPLQKWNYYRLEQVDISSDKKLSNTVAIEFDKYGNLIVLYPNPADNELHIEYNSASSGNVTIQIFDSKGSKVLTRNESIAEGKYTHSLNIAHLSPGIYMLQYLQPNGTAYNVKFTKK